MSRIRKVVELESEDVEWFENTYPAGSFSWLFNILLHEFRDATKLTPQDVAKIATRELRDQLE